MNDIYIYDGTFIELFVLIGELLYLKKEPSDIKCESEYVPSLFDNTIKLELKKKKEKFEYLNKIFSKRVIHCIYYVYLSNNINKEMIIYDFIKNTFIYKDKIFHYRNIDSVNNVIKISGYVGSEAHKLKGFLRFKLMKNKFLYAEYNSTNNVIEILANHFKKRLSTELWIIKDIERGIYAVYDTNNLIFLGEDDIIKLNLNLDSNEELIEDLWKSFFKTITIKERENLKVQRNFMPKKYWDNIIEMEDRI